MSAINSGWLYRMQTRHTWHTVQHVRQSLENIVGPGCHSFVVIKITFQRWYESGGTEFTQPGIQVSSGLTKVDITAIAQSEKRVLELL